jgi:hypothetical protein
MTPKNKDRLGTMALALILAIIVWVVAQQQESPLETTVITDIPVTVRNMPENLVPLDGSSYPPVEVRVRAPRSILETLSRNSLTAFIEEYSPPKAIVVCNEGEERVHGQIRIMPYRDFLHDLWSGKIIH